MKKYVVLALLMSAATLAHATDDATGACEQMKSFAMEGIVIDSAAPERSGAFATSLGSTLNNLPAFCRVVGHATPTPQSRVGFEVWLPEKNWSGRYVQVGNGGLAGVIFHQLLGQMIDRGHATASTDNGHTASPVDGRWAIGQPEKVRDHAERAVHLLSDIGKKITAAYYESAAKHSYFFGCSEGGREAMIEAQRFPQDFDGIVAGAPAHYWTDLLDGFMRSGLALHKDPASFIPPAKLPIIQEAALAACDANDGIKDGLVSAPEQCKFDPKVLECKKGGDESQCLTAPQVAALRTLYLVGYVPSGENETAVMGGGVRQYAFGAAQGQSLQIMFASGYFGGFVFEKPDWDYRTYDLTRDFATARDKLGALMDASKTDLSEFERRGGKLIHYHGLLDGSIPPGMSKVYYDRVAKQTGGVSKTQEFYRLFMAPGVLHCGFGPGPNAFGNLGPRPPADADHDTLLALQKWVEEGVAPKQIVATKYVDDDPAKGVSMTRPLCPYPQTAQYDGKGKIESSASFACQ
ncbi:MAG TPA: tannase/feruloyl esterase family alpha/beta hydrolase [Steroidobacteraceae bacterium]|nr:tannase/feruloyl esterase family alpha/beta hydrolase [Steroidobacteraceae bacterium]